MPVELSDDQFINKINKSNGNVELFGHIDSGILLVFLWLLLLSILVCLFFAYMPTILALSMLFTNNVWFINIVLLKLVFIISPLGLFFVINKIVEDKFSVYIVPKQYFKILNKQFPYGVVIDYKMVIKNYKASVWVFIKNKKDPELIIKDVDVVVAKNLIEEIKSYA